MEQVIISEHAGIPVAGTPGSLPVDRAEWPDEARRAFRSVLRQLDSWCRDRNRSRHGNVWVAEEAVRQAW